jgi:hypothetical protein
MFTVATTKHRSRKQSFYDARRGEVKTVGEKSLDAMVAQAWGELTSGSKAGKPPGVGWRTLAELDVPGGQSMTARREWVKKNLERLEVTRRMINDHWTVFVRPKALSLI